MLPTKFRFLQMAAELMAAWKTALQFLQFFDVLWSIRTSIEYDLSGLDHIQKDLEEIKSGMGTGSRHLA